MEAMPSAMVKGSLIPALARNIFSSEENAAVAAPKAGPSKDSNRMSGLLSMLASISHISSLRAIPPETEMRCIFWPAFSWANTPRVARQASASREARNFSAGVLGSLQSIPSEVGESPGLAQGW